MVRCMWISGNCPPTGWRWLCRRLARRDFPLDSHGAGRPAGPLQDQGPVVAELAGADRGDPRQHRPRFSGREQKLQPVLFRDGPLTMFEILRKSLETGVVTTRYPATPVEVASNARGRPEIDWAQCWTSGPPPASARRGRSSMADAAGVRTASPTSASASLRPVRRRRPGDPDDEPVRAGMSQPQRAHRHRPLHAQS